jgi:phage baseplate assembly protein gpV/phage protein D
VNSSRSTSGVYTLPRITVEADGGSLTPAEMRALGQVRVQQRLSQPALCEMTFYDPPGPLDAVTNLEPGTELRVTLSGHMDPLFVGQVTAVEHVYGATHEHQVHVRGYDRLHQLRKRQSVRAHVQVTPRDLAQELVADLGLSVEADESGPLWQRLIQHQQSDLELLFEVTEQCGLYFTLADDVLHLLTLEGRGDPVPLALGDSLHEARIETSGEPACRTVTASGWNPLLVETYEGLSGNARVGRDVSAEVAPDLVGASGERSLPDETVQSVNHAEALAQAELDRRVAREVTLWGIAEGDPRLRPGTPVEIENVVDTLSGRYVLTAVTHTVDRRKGFVSELSTAPPPPRRRHRSTIAALGTVTRVDDPLGRGRVRVCLPTYGDVETEWMHVLSAGAGENKGLVILPDVDDRVLVLFSQEAPGLGIVLGGLYGMQGPHDSGVEGNAVKRYTILTSGGHCIRLDDEQETVYLEDSTGSYVKLSPESVHLYAAVDLIIEAPEQAIVIRGQTIDFERG